MNNVFYTKIAGVNFRATEKHVGHFLGYIESVVVESDPNAIGIFNSDGEQLGFVPVLQKERLTKFLGSELAPENQVYCSGHIKKVVGKEGNAYFVGSIAIINPSQPEDDLKNMLLSHYNKEFDVDKYGRAHFL